MSASSYSRVVNRNRLRTHSSTTSTAAEVATTHHRRGRPALAGAPPVPAVTAGTAVSRSLLMLTRLSPYRRPYRGMLLSRFLFQTMIVYGPVWYVRAGRPKYFRTSACGSQCEKKPG